MAVRGRRETTDVSQSLANLTTCIVHVPTGMSSAGWSGHVHCSKLAVALAGTWNMANAAGRDKILLGGGTNDAKSKSQSPKFKRLLKITCIPSIHRVTSLYFYVSTLLEGFERWKI